MPTDTTPTTAASSGGFLPDEDHHGHHDDDASFTAYAAAAAAVAGSSPQHHPGASSFALPPSPEAAAAAAATDVGDGAFDPMAMASIARAFREEDTTVDERKPAAQQDPIAPPAVGFEGVEDPLAPDAAANLSSLDYQPPLALYPHLDADDQDESSPYANGVGLI